MCARRSTHTPDTPPNRPPMPDTPNLRPATRDELTWSLSFALRFNGRRRIHRADDLMAQITVERLVEYLERAGYVVMCKPSLTPHRVNLGAEIDKVVKIRREE